jgi:hypothetical protein
LALNDKRLKNKIADWKDNQQGQNYDLKNFPEKGKKFVHFSILKVFKFKIKMIE